MLGSDLTATRSDTLGAIGDGLKRRLLDFAAATKLRDLTRSGRVDEVRATLKGIIDKAR